MGKEKNKYIVFRKEATFEEMRDFINLWEKLKPEVIEDGNKKDEVAR
jgi:hypothetical protein